MRTRSTFLAVLVVGLATTAGSQAGLARLLTYPDHEGFVEWRATGDAGSEFVIRYDYKGFYVVYLPALSAMLDRGMTPSGDTADAFFVHPIRTNVSVKFRGKNSSSSEWLPRRTDCTLGEHAVSFETSATLPDENTVRTFTPLGPNKWPAGPPFTDLIHILDRRKAGGGVRLETLGLTSHDLIGSYRYTKYDAPGTVRDTQSAATRLGYVIEFGENR